MSHFKDILITVWWVKQVVVVLVSDDMLQIIFSLYFILGDIRPCDHWSYWIVNLNYIVCIYVYYVWSYFALATSITTTHFNTNTSYYLGGLLQSPNINTSNNSSNRSVLHVKSMSSWAPLCIGPYAQANIIDKSIIYVAGQIPLNPSTMKIVDSDRIDENLGMWLQL